MSRGGEYQKEGMRGGQNGEKESDGWMNKRQWMTEWRLLPTSSWSSSSSRIEEGKLDYFSREQKTWGGEAKVLFESDLPFVPWVQSMHLPHLLVIFSSPLSYWSITANIRPGKEEMMWFKKGIWIIEDYFYPVWGSLALLSFFSPLILFDNAKSMNTIRGFPYRIKKERITSFSRTLKTTLHLSPPLDIVTSRPIIKRMSVENLRGEEDVQKDDNCDHPHDDDLTDWTFTMPLRLIFLFCCSFLLSSTSVYSTQLDSSPPFLFFLFTRLCLWFSPLQNFDGSSLLASCPFRILLSRGIFFFPWITLLKTFVVVTIPDDAILPPFAPFASFVVWIAGVKIQGVREVLIPFFHFLSSQKEKKSFEKESIWTNGYKSL